MDAHIPPPPVPPVPVFRQNPSSPPPQKSSRAPLYLMLGCFGFIALCLVSLILSAVLGGGVEGIGLVEKGSVLRMKLSGEIPEYVAPTGLEDFFGAPPTTVRQHVFNLEKAAKDERVKGVLLELEPLQVGFAKIEELRDALLEFKKSGKFVLVYSEMLSEREYALAVAADHIIMPHDSWFEFDGLATDIAHYPGLLEKLGIEIQYFRYGKYKSTSGEQMGRKEFTAPVKEMINENLNLTFQHFVQAVTTFRKIDADTVKKLIDVGQRKSDWAFENKLIDQLGYWDDAESYLRTKLGNNDAKKIQFVSAERYRKVSADDAGLTYGKHAIALIYSTGIIVSGKGSGDEGGGNQGSIPLIREIRRAVADESVKAILFRVDSPGGSGLGCDYVRREIELAKSKKPVIVSMSDTAASGGYWVSMDATAIVAQPSTATGSIGIYTLVPSFAGLYDKLGLNNEVFKVGAHADSLILARKFTDEEAAQWDANLFASYNRFVSLAAKGRGIDETKMQELAQGRTWLGAQAKANGLVDALGGFPTAIALAKEKSGLSPDEKVKLILFEKKTNWIDRLTNRDLEEDEDNLRLSTVLWNHVAQSARTMVLLKQVPHLAAFAKDVLESHHHQYALLEYEVSFH